LVQLPSFDDGLKKALGRHNGKLIGLMVFLILFIIELLFIYLWVWPNIILALWIWEKQPWYYAIIASIADFFLIIVIIILVWFSTFDYIQKIITWYAEEDKNLVETSLKEFEEEEKKIAEEIGKKDDAGLLPTVRYSGEQLKTYYKMSMQQTRRSFYYSVIAMFIGFFIILIGIASAFGFFEYFLRGIKSPDINNIVIAGGVLAETISALFLWVYNKTSSQLNYFYNRQIHAHNIILAFRIADTMSDKKMK